MSKQEIHEIHEHAHEVEHYPQLLPVTITMSILAVFIAVISLFGHRAHTEALLNQTKSTDQWAYYQAKNIRKHSLEQFADLLTVITPKDEEQAKTLQDKFKKESERYTDEQKEIENEARNLENETSLEKKKADRFDFGEILLEAALVIASMTLLTKWRIFWFGGICLGIIGILLGASGFLIP